MSRRRGAGRPEWLRHNLHHAGTGCERGKFLLYRDGAMKPGKKKPSKKKPTLKIAAKTRAVRGKGAGRDPVNRRRAAVSAFYSDALAIELEASERYRALAQEMQANDNPRTAELFLKLAQFETGHADKLRELAASAKLSTRARSRILAQDAGRTEVPNYQFLYRRVPPQHALLMALEAERRAKIYFEQIRRTTADPEIKKLAAKFAREEIMHIAWLEEALAIEPQPVNPFDDFPVPSKSAK